MGVILSVSLQTFHTIILLLSGSGVGGKIVKIHFTGKMRNSLCVSRLLDVTRIKINSTKFISRPADPLGTSSSTTSELENIYIMIVLVPMKYPESPIYANGVPSPESRTKTTAFFHPGTTANGIESEKWSEKKIDELKCQCRFAKLSFCVCQLAAVFGCSAISDCI